jgi:hypothetical protein
MSKWINTRNAVPFDQDMPSNRGRMELVLVAYMLPEEVVDSGRLYFSLGIFTHEGWGIQRSRKDRYVIVFWRPMDDVMEELHQFFDERAHEEGFSMEYIKPETYES